MNTATWITLLILTVVLGFAFYRIAKKAKHGGGCCGEHETTPEKIQVKDKNKKHYPYHVKLEIGGMTCSNCARRVENVLNSLQGTMAKVDINSKTAIVYSKEKINEAVYKEAIQKSGYVVIRVLEK